MSACQFLWENEVVYGEYFNSDIAEFKRTRSELRVRQCVRCLHRVVARQGLTLGLFSGSGGALLDKTPTHRFFENYRFDQMALSPSGEMLAVAAGHQVQFVKLEGNRFMPTGRLAGDAKEQSSLLELSFFDEEHCLAVSARACMVFERGNCLSVRPLEQTLVRPAGTLALEARPACMGLYRTAGWELLDEWPVQNVRALALSSRGRCAWIDDRGFHLRQDGVDLEAEPKPPTPNPVELHFGGQRLFMREGESKVWQWRPEAPRWQEWKQGEFIGTSDQWWMAVTPDGFASYCDDSR